MKKCFKCGEVKCLTEFYKHPMMADGHVNKCKECNKRDVRENRNNRIDYYREYEKSRANNQDRVEAREAYQKTERGKEVGRKAKKKWAMNNPANRHAQVVVGNAVRDGRLKKLPCKVCGSTNRIHGHHDDYSKPLDVIWLCPKHHSERHKEIRSRK